MDTVHFNYENNILHFDHTTRDASNQKILPHSHNVCEILLIKRGNITYTVDGRQYRVSANDLIFTRPSDIHSLENNDSSVYERYNILFDEKKLPFNIFEKIPRMLDVIRFEDDHTVPNLFEKMDYYCAKLYGEELKMMLTNLIEEVFINIIIESQSAKEYQYIQTNDLICRAVEYIDEHILTLNGIEDICNSLFITKSHLHHLFTKHLKTSPKKFIIAKRLTLAQREINAGEKPTEIYQKCGFTDYSAFYRAYLNHFGYRPSDKQTPQNMIITPKNNA